MSEERTNCLEPTGSLFFLTFSLQLTEPSANIQIMDKQNTIKIHTAKVDNYTPVIALDTDGNLVIDHYGTFGTGPYLRIDEVFAALKTHEPRTDAERMALLKGGYTYCWFVTTPFTENDKYIGLYDPNGTQLTDSSHFFQTITEALDYVLDMEEQA